MDINKMVSDWKAKRNLDGKPLEIPESAHNKGLAQIRPDDAKAILGNMTEILAKRKSRVQHDRTL